MKKIRQFLLSGIALLMLIACSNDPVVPPTPDPNPQEDVDDGGITEGTGIDDLHSKQTDKPAYRRQ